MTEDEVLAAIKAAIPASSAANADVISQALLAKAIIKLGRLPGQSWNSEAVTFTLTSGTSTYKIGQDILADFADFVNMQFLWRTDTTDEPIPILTVQEFNHYARGSTSTGGPEIATLHSNNETLEFWPAPNSNYTVWGYAQKKVTAFEDIPENLHDVLIDLAIESIDPRMAAVRAQQGIKDAKGMSLTRWDGNTIPIARNVGQVSNTARATSYNLRGD